MKIFRVYPFGICMKFLLAAVSGAVLPLTMLFTQNMIDSLNAGIQDSIFYALCLGGVLFLSVISIHLDEYISLQISNRLELYFGNEIYLKCGRISYQNYENPEVYEIIGRILGQYRQSLGGAVGLISMCLRFLFLSCGILVYLTMLEWWMILILLVTMLPVFVITVITSMKEYDTFSKYYPFFRKAQYLSGLITGRPALKEIRLFQCRQFVEEKWETSIRKFQTEQIRANIGPRFLAGFFIFFQYAVTIFNLFLLFPAVREGTVSMGIYIAIAQAMWSFVGSFQYEIIALIKGAESYRQFTRDLRLFFNLADTEEKTEGSGVCFFDELRLENIWYRYREDGPYILKGVDMTIPRGHKVGFVGENGSGKSTLIKIMLGLLSPEKGNIFLNGIEIYDGNRYLLKMVMYGVFQDYARFDLTLKESISLGRRDDVDIGRMKEIMERIQGGGELQNALRQDLDIRLGRERWDGQDLSGGQWQAIAVARGIYSGRPFLILDEPAAALDPIAEVDLYRQIYYDGGIQTALLATHRLGGIVTADHIYLLTEGRISEKGTHEELMDLDGRYADMFRIQSGWYRKETV